MTQKKDQLLKRLKKLEGIPDPAKGKTEVTIQDVTSTKSGLEDLKPERKKQQTYKSVKVKTEQYERLQRIIDANSLDSIGVVINKLIEGWCDQNELV